MKRLISIMMMAILACGLSAQDHDVMQFIANLMSKYPKARLLDIYKSSFQDYMGAEHLVNDAASARAYLEQELTMTDIDELMPWYYEPCGVDGRHVRVSLRTVMEGLISADLLLDAFLESADKVTHPTVEEWVVRWHEMIETIDKMALNLPNYDDDKQYIEQVLAQGHYAISHSQDYREAYSPHYRIIERQIFEERINRSLPLSH